MAMAAPMSPIFQSSAITVNRRAGVTPVWSVGSRRYDADRRPAPTPNDRRVRETGLASRSDAP